MARDCKEVRWTGGAYCPPCEKKIAELGWDKLDGIVVIAKAAAQASPKKKARRKARGKKSNRKGKDV